MERNFFSPPGSSSRRVVCGGVEDGVGRGADQARGVRTLPDDGVVRNLHLRQLPLNLAHERHGLPGIRAGTSLQGTDFRYITTSHNSCAPTYPSLSAANSYFADNS